MTAGKLIGVILLQILLIMANAFFAATEIAVLQLSPGKLRKQAEEGDRHAPRILTMVDNPSNFLSAIQVGITLAGYLGSAFAADNFAGPLVDWVYNTLQFQAIPYTLLRTMSIILITIILSYFTLVFGELVPKQLALHKPYQVAKVTTGFIRGLAVIMKPVIKLLSASTNAVLKLIGIREGEGGESVTEDEIRMMVDVGHETGAIDLEEKEMIDNVFELDKTIARDVMTHRVDVTGIEADAEEEEVVDIIKGSGMSRFPVYDDSYDDILGVLNSRTYLLNLRSKNPKTMRELIRPAHFVPETVQADVLLREMQQRKDHLAIVLDEYGGFSGIVTMEDLIEEIVGNIYDEFDAPAELDIIKLEDNLWRVAGDTDIEDIEDELDIKIPEDREYDTLSGLVFSQLSSIPDDGVEITCEIYGLHIHTDPVQDHHVKWAQISVIVSEEPGSNADENDGKKTNGNGRKDNSTAGKNKN